MAKLRKNEINAKGKLTFLLHFRVPVTSAEQKLRKKLVKNDGIWRFPSVEEKVNGLRENSSETAYTIKLFNDVLVSLLVHCYILPFVTITNIAWNLSTAITKTTSTQIVPYVFCTRATTTVTPHCSHSSAGPTCLPLLNRHWVMMMFYYNSCCPTIGISRRTCIVC